MRSIISSISKILLGLMLVTMLVACGEDQPQPAPPPPPQATPQPQNGNPGQAGQPGQPGQGQGQDECGGGYWYQGWDGYWYYYEGNYSKTTGKCNYTYNANYGNSGWEDYDWSDYDNYDDYDSYDDYDDYWDSKRKVSNSR